MIALGLALVGLLVVGRWLARLAFALYCHCAKLGDLPARYGAGSWAVVTGGSDGIGFGFCQELAAAGMNVCLVSRSAKKMQEKIDLLKLEYPSVHYKYIVADF
jgi:17beta-estradiol 17-dehydrogenase / very-long-chain 3-oxoacyl-CoA reductase